MNHKEQPSITNPNTPMPCARKSPVPKVIGLAGGIASGKSTVAAMFAELGAEVIDADAVAHEVLRSPGVCETLRRDWGEAVIGHDGAPNREAIARIVFDSPARLSELNDLVHPETKKEIRSRLKHTLRSPRATLVIIDAPLLIETQLRSQCDAVLFVEADGDRRAERATAMRAWPDGELARREAAQASIEDKRKCADMTINNNGSPEETRAQVAALYRTWARDLNPSSQEKPSGGKDNGQAEDDFRQTR